MLEAAVVVTKHPDWAAESLSCDIVEIARVSRGPKILWSLSGCGCAVDLFLKTCLPCSWSRPEAVIGAGFASDRHSFRLAVKNNVRQLIRPIIFVPFLFLQGTPWNKSLKIGDLLSLAIDAINAMFFIVNV